MDQAIERFRGYERLTVRQRRKWLEVIFSFELANRYQVFDEDQRAVLEVREVGTSFLSLLARLFLGPTRPFKAEIAELDGGQVVMRLERPFRFIFQQLDVYGADGALLGSVVKRWSWFRRIYEIKDASGAVLALLFGPFFKPWTFEIRSGERVLGSIKKRWSGLGRELFTDADNFGVILSDIPDPLLRALAFAATVLVDVVHFERAK
jgi:uncharacterized protein YxjI